MTPTSSRLPVSDASYARLVQPLWDYLTIAQKPAPADVIFVFGSQDLAVPARAAALHRARHAPRVLVTGYFGRMTRDVFDEPEALVFRDHMVRAGVPEAAIVTESAAANTLENVRFGLAALHRRGDDVKSALLVAKGFVMRRCVATFGAQASAVRVLACPPSARLRDGIDRSPLAFAARLVAELDRLERYGVRGDIVRQNIPPAIRATAERVRRLAAGGENPASHRDPAR